MTQRFEHGSHKGPIIVIAPREFRQRIGVLPITDNSTLDARARLVDYRGLPWPTRTGLRALSSPLHVVSAALPVSARALVT